MGDENPIRTLGDYSRPNHEGYQNTIELPDGNNVVPLRSYTIRLVQNGCSFHELSSKDPNQHLKDFLKLMDSLDLDVANRERMRLHLFQFSLRDQASNWLELQIFYAMSIPPQGEPSNNRPVVSYVKNTEESWALLKDLALYDNETWDDPDFTKTVKANSLPQDVTSTSNRRLINLENQVQCLMGAHLAPKSSVQVNKIASSCEICSGPHNTQYCMENPEQDFVDYASLRTDEARGKWFIFKPDQNNLGDTYNPSWKSHPNLRGKQPQNPQKKLNPPNRFQPNSSFPNRSLNNNPQNFNNQSNLEGLVSNFMASQDARLSKFKVDFRQQQSKMTNKIDIFLKAINDRMTGALSSDKSLELGKNRSAFIQGETAEKMKDPGLFTLPCDEEVIYWTTLGKGESYKPQPSMDGIGTRTSYYARKDFMDYHLSREWKIARDFELNPFKDVIVFRKMVEFLGTTPINLIINMWELEVLIGERDKLE
uniref:MAK10-like protein n=1 Tax=Tanacetum cinerariifolium TaxID=118510 RepID=A0A6L2JIB6_TANCI|nr:MAK10-like protein [Tanacetum cinerariifolium]